MYYYNWTEGEKEFGCSIFQIVDLYEGGVKLHR